MTKGGDASSAALIGVKSTFRANAYENATAPESRNTLFEAHATARKSKQIEESSSGDPPELAISPEKVCFGCSAAHCASSLPFEI